MRLPVASKHHRAAAFFDLDRTLLAVNSGRLWMKRERQLGRISRWQVVQGTAYLVAYKFAVIDMERVTTAALQTVKGELEETVRQWTRDWYRREVAQHAAPGAWSVLRAHREAGDRLVLLTSSSPYESAIASEQFGMDAALSSRYEVVDGRFTGNTLTPVCYGPGKVVYAERYAGEHDIDLRVSFNYADSMSDLPMLERVGNPRVVNPDPRLRRIARKRRWPILDWR